MSAERAAGAPVRDVTRRAPDGVRGPAVRVCDIKKTYRGRTVLDVPELALSAGGTHVLLGPSGSGKSTLLRIVGLLERPDTGAISWDGVAVRHSDRSTRLKMAAVFQESYLFKGTVADNVAYGLKLRRTSAEERATRVDKALRIVGLSEMRDSSALTLSGGEGQRVALARALVLEPSVLLLDEPLSSLDPLIKRRLMDDFSRILRGQGVTVLYVTHDQDEAMVVGDDVSIMRDGRIVRSGRAEDVMGLPTDSWVAGFIGMEEPLRGRIEENAEGVAAIRCDGAVLFGVTDFSPGTEVILGVRPEDITLFHTSEAVPASSARNRLVCRVTRVEPRGATVRVTLDCGGVRLASAVSRASVRELGLDVGETVTALFKATAVRVGRAEDGEVPLGV